MKQAHLALLIAIVAQPGELTFAADKSVTGSEALQRLATLLPTVLLSSLRLPDMSGLELATRIRDTLRWLESGIVLMSSDDWTPQRQSAAEQLGRLRLLKKPFDASGLRKAIEESLSDTRDRWAERPASADRR